MTESYSSEIGTVQAYLSGNQQIEKQLFHKLKKLIFKLICIMESKGANFADKNNLVDEIVFQILAADDRKVLRSYNGRSKLSTFLWPIVRNKIVDAIRKEKRYNSKITHQELPEISLNNPQSSPGTVETLIEGHIASQPPLERFIKISKWMQELNYQEIIAKAKDKFPKDVELNSQRIAYVLHTNRKVLQKKLKISGFKFD